MSYPIAGNFGVQGGGSSSQRGSGDGGPPGRGGNDGSRSHPDYNASCPLCGLPMYTNGQWHQRNGVYCNSGQLASRQRVPQNPNQGVYTSSSAQRRHTVAHPYPAPMAGMPGGGAYPPPPPLAPVPAQAPAAPAQPIPKPPADWQLREGPNKEQVNSAKNNPHQQQGSSTNRRYRAKCPSCPRNSFGSRIEYELHVSFCRRDRNPGPPRT
ncbi:hypothetical protein EXIGLDRAFT_700935 [Exidia glandulosa HHB12029]|uniref:Uncharacterized protein n=1 Tax=Exidia glandulosa HHB12029 TaxID=1314781 RepID=A0A165D7C5_EXIGL|nr:hypothetical protein EXIGLDRAFT_700935 [Exidia glandulosa HHB12029]